MYGKSEITKYYKKGLFPGIYYRNVIITTNITVFSYQSIFVQLCALSLNCQFGLVYLSIVWYTTSHHDWLASL